MLLVTGEGVCANKEYLLYSKPGRSLHILIRATGVKVQFNNVRSGSDGAGNDRYRKMETDQHWNDQDDDDIPRIILDLDWDHERGHLLGYFEYWDYNNGYSKHDVSIYCIHGFDGLGNYTYFKNNLKK